MSRLANSCSDARSFANKYCLSYTLVLGEAVRSLCSSFAMAEPQTGEPNGGLMLRRIQA